MRGSAAHHAGIRADDDEGQPGAAEDALVGGPVVAVLRIQPGLVAIQAVAVLHGELADADQTAARARLIAPLGLDVVNERRQLAVGIDLLPHEVGHDLLVRHGQHHVALATVMEAGHLRANLVEAARFLPDIGGVHDGHQHLLPADGVDLLADDLLHLGDHAPAQGEQAVDASAERPHHGGAQHQPVAGQLDVARRLTQGPAEEMGHPHTLANLIFPQ